MWHASKTCVLCVLLLFLCGASAIKVVVVGAGMAGLTTARTLVDSAVLPDGVTLEITVLEAMNRLGGRTYTKPAAAFNFTGASGGVLDAGASWIHGSNRDHPTTKMCEALGLERLETTEEDIKIFSAARSEVDTSASWDSFQEISGEAQGGASEGESLWQALEGVEASDGKTRDTADMQYWLADVEFNEGGKATTIGAVTVGNAGGCLLPRLLDCSDCFADERFYGSAHNAFFTGQRAARSILRAEDLAPADALSAGATTLPVQTRFCFALSLMCLFVSSLRGLLCRSS